MLHRVRPRAEKTHENQGRAFEKRISKRKKHMTIMNTRLRFQFLNKINHYCTAFVYSLGQQSSRNAYFVYIILKKSLALSALTSKIWFKKVNRSLENRRIRVIYI